MDARVTNQACRLEKWQLTLPHHGWWWNTPGLSSAEVAYSMVGPITACTQRGFLAMSPLFARKSMYSLTVVTVAPCPEATVYTWPRQHSLSTNSMDLASHGPVHMQGLLDTHVPNAGILITVPSTRLLKMIHDFLPVHAIITTFLRFRR